MTTAYCPQCGEYDRMYRARSPRLPELDFAIQHTDVCWACFYEIAVFYGAWRRIVYMRRPGTDEKLSVL